MDEEKLTVAEVLREILKKDPTILGRRDDLLQMLDENRNKIIGTQMKSFRSLQKALRESNIGDIFAAANSRMDKDKEESRANAKDIAEQKLREGSTQEKTIQNVIKILVTALDWDKYSLEEMPVEKASSMNIKREKKNKVSSSDISKQKKSQNLVEKLSSHVFSEPQSQQQKLLEDKLETLQNRKKRQRNIFISIVAVLIIIIGFIFFKETFSEHNLKSQTQSVAQQEDNKETKIEDKAQSDLSLNGIDLGSDKSNIEDSYGNPDEVTNVNGKMVLYYYGKFKVTEDESGSIIAMESSEADVKTKRGIHKGSTLFDIENAYGTGYTKSDSNDVIFYEYSFPSINGDSGTLRFAIDESNNTVRYISVKLNRDVTYSNKETKNTRDTVKLTELRIGKSYDNMTRLVFSSQGMVQEPNISIVNSHRLSIDVPNAQVAEEEQRNVGTSFIKDVNIQQLNQNTVRIIIDTNIKAEYRNYRVFGLDSPTRLVIDVGENIKPEDASDAKFY